MIYKIVITQSHFQEHIFSNRGYKSDIVLGNNLSDIAFFVSSPPVDGML